MWSPTSVPALLTAVPGMHGSFPFVRQLSHSPQRGRKTVLTCWPTVRSVTLSPTFSTTPEASWPRSIGMGRGRLPSTTDRSEWHRPAARTRMRTSSGPGSSSSRSTMRSGLLSAYGRCAVPTESRTAPVIFMMVSSV